MTPAQLLARALRADATRPLLTFYDDATGERVELSVATTANWVAKTANLLVDSLDVQPGDAVSVRLPVHWQATVVLLACWSVGADITDALPARLLVTSEDELPVESPADDVLALSLRPMGAGLLTPRADVVDYAAEVLSHGDVFTPIEESGQPLAAQAQAAGLPAGERVLLAAPYDDEDTIVQGLLAPLAVGGSVVLCRNLDESKLADRVATERVTRVLSRPA